MTKIRCRRRMLWAALLWGCATGAVWAQGPAVSAARLISPGDAEQISISPSGSRLGAVIVGNGDAQTLLVLEWRGGTLTPILLSRLGNERSIAGYRWLSDDYLLVQYTEAGEQVYQPAIADIAHRNIRFNDLFNRVVRTPWGDADHALVSGGQECGSGVQTCLRSLDLANGHSVQISPNVPLLPVSYVALSPAEIYATGRDDKGMQRAYRLDQARHAWQPTDPATVEARRVALQSGAAPSADAIAAAVKAGVHGGRLVYTEPSHHLVGVIGRAPEPAFVSLDAGMDGVQTMLQKDYPQARIDIAGLNDQLTRGMVTVWDTDQPQRYFFFNDNGELTQFTQLSPQIDAAQLGRTHIERSWVSDVPVSVTLPPAGVALIGAVVVPYTAAAALGEEPLHEYSPAVQSLALRGIASARMLAPMPTAFADNGAGAAWRTTVMTQLQSVVEHVSADLLHGAAVCLYGNGTNGELALAAGALPHVGCVVAVNARLDSQAATERNEIPDFALSERQRSTWGTIFAPSEQLLRRDLPAVYGQSDGGRLGDSLQWVNRLPPRLMLAYNLDIQALTLPAQQSGSFRSAAQKAGRSVVFYAPAPKPNTERQYAAGMLDAVTDYLAGFYQGATTTAAR